MRMLHAVGGLLTLLVLTGCPKKTEETKAEAGAPSTSASTSTSTSADGEAPTAAKAGAAGAASSFKGKYTVAAGTMYVPEAKDWASVKFKNDDSKLLGDGELSLAIDAAGRVTGSSEGGPLGAAVIEGKSDGQTLAATVRRKDPADDGLTGTLLATVAGDKVDGTMKLAEFNAAVVRTATFSVTKK
jgi:hypothetical protein